MIIHLATVEDLALKLGCRFGELPTTYMGLSLGAPFKAMSVWDSVKKINK